MVSIKIPLTFSSKTIKKFLFVVCFGNFSNRISHPTNRIHHIPVDTIIVSIKTNTIPIITIKSLHFYCVLGRFYSFFSCTCQFWPFTLQNTFLKAVFSKRVFNKSLVLHRILHFFSCSLYPEGFVLI